MHLTPRKGLRVPMPERGGIFLPAAGAECPDSRYWRRRLAEGAVTRSAPAASPKSPEKRG